MNTTIISVLQALCIGRDIPACARVNTTLVDKNQTKVFGEIGTKPTRIGKGVSLDVVQQAFSSLVYSTISDRTLAGDMLTGSLFSKLDRKRWSVKKSNGSLSDEQISLLSFRMQIAILTQARMTRQEMIDFQSNITILIILVFLPAILLLCLATGYSCYKIAKCKKEKKQVRRQRNARRFLSDLHSVRMNQLRSRAATQGSDES